MNTHTDLDEAALVGAGINPATTQAREHAVRCDICRAETWHLSGRCAYHYRTPPVITARKARTEA